MAASILTQDVLAICLFLSDGNIELPLEEVISRAEDFQEVEDRHFGTLRSDYRNLFHMLFGWELRIMSLSDEFGDIKLRDTITFILKYHSVFFNEEGEYWDTDNDKWNKNIEYWFSYDEKKYQEKLIVKQEMGRFFEHQKIATLHPKLVKKFMEELKITDTVLYSCSRSGESS